MFIFYFRCTMKTSLLLIISSLFFFDSYSQKLTYEISGGVNVSNLKSIVDHNGKLSESSLDHRTSFYFGLGTEFKLKNLGDQFFINLQFQYSEQGSSYYYSYLGSRVFDRVNQFNVPIRLKMNVFDKLTLGFGGYFGYILLTDNYLYEDSENFTKFDSGLILSLDYKLFGAISLESKFLYGITDILNREFDGGAYKHNKYNRVFQLGINYKF